MAGFKDPTKAFPIQRLLVGAKKLDAPTPRHLPITFDLLKNIVDAIPAAVTLLRNQILFKAVFLLMYHACLRVGEVASSNHSKHTLRIENVLMSGPSANHKIIIVLETFKHSRRPALLALPEANNVNYCPKTALVNFLKIRSAANGPLFTNERGIGISRAGISLSRAERS